MISDLVWAGHSEERILAVWTLPQVWFYHRRAVRARERATAREAHLNFDAVHSAVAGVMGDKNPFEHFQKQIRAMILGRKP